MWLGDVAAVHSSDPSRYEASAADQMTFPFRSKSTSDEARPARLAPARLMWGSSGLYLRRASVQQASLQFLSGAMRQRLVAGFQTVQLLLRKFLDV
jgi:hypothetical protein